MSMQYPDPLVSAARAEPHSPSMFSSILRRRKMTVLGIAALAVLVTIAITARETKVYDATASVVVQGPPTTGGQNQVNMATEAAVAGSPAVAELVVKHEHLTGVTARQLSGHLSVHVPVDSQVLQFTYASPNPRVAQELSEAFAAAYLSFRTGEQAQTTAQAIAAVQKQIDDNTRQLALIKEIIPTLSGQPLAVATGEGDRQAGADLNAPAEAGPSQHEHGHLRRPAGPGTVPEVAGQPAHDREPGSRAVPGALAWIRSGRRSRVRGRSDP